VNTYKVTVKGNDILGIQWLHNIVKIANMGGVIEERFHIKTSFPHEVTMLVQTENDLRLETDMKAGIIVYPVMVAKTREEMEALDWEEFKRECRAWGIAGRHRDTMTNLYMAATEQSDGVKVAGKEDASVKKKPSKKPVKKPEKKEPSPKESTPEEDAGVDTNTEE